MASKDIKYVGRDFDGFKNNLIEFAKNYFPATYNDFDTASPGAMFIEMASYVGDVLSYYTDYALKESMIHRATERKNLYDLAQGFGYKPKVSVAATCTLDVYIKIPAMQLSTGDNAFGGVDSVPDWDYAPIIESGMVVKTDGDIKFTTMDSIDFQASSSMDPTEVSVHTINSTTSNPEYYLLMKSVIVSSGEIKTATYTGNGKKSQKFTIEDNNVISVNSVTDADTNTWYEVPYLAQDTIFGENVNTDAFDPSTSADKVGTPYILTLKKTPRRFVTRISDTDNIVLQFGSGINGVSDSIVLPNPNNVGSNLAGSSDNLNTAFDPSNFMKTKTYGKAPSEALTISYTKGYGIASNVSTGTITSIASKTITQNSDDVTSALQNIVTLSLAVNNPEPASGGKSQETIEDIRENALAHFSTQQRAVTKEDYIIRAYSMPPKFGSVPKVFITNDTQVDLKTREEVANPLALNLFVLGYNANKQLANVNAACKKNLKNYLSQFRMMTDSVNIKNGYVINLGIDFEVVVLSGFNSRTVILKCIDKLKALTHIDNMQFMQPLIIKDYQLELSKIEGVQSVMKFEIRNKWRTSLGYSGNKYNLEDANKGGIIYPSKDPSIFEIKYPNADIQGRATTY
tara:strand:+ start:18904 stop:20787 length:1884 start_codon:yes stop_codon:yes gene_type:complete